MTTESQYAGTFGSGNFASGTNWASDSSAQGSPDGAFATDTLLHGVTGASGDVYNWGFSTVSGAVNGISAVVTAKASAGAVEFINTYVEAGSTTGDFTANNLTPSTLLTTSSATYNTGSGSDLCGIGSSLTPTNVTSNTEGSGLTLGFRFKNTSGSVTESAQIDAVQCTCTFTAVSPPGTPTGLAASNAGPTAIGLVWVQGSGTVTDSKIRYGTDGTTFGSSIDIGSPATSYTVTGLTFGQLYFFEVSASNSAGDTYSSAVPYVCGSDWTGQVAASANDAFENASGTVSITDASDTLSGASEFLGCRFPSVPATLGRGLAAAQLWLYVTAGGASSSVAFDCELSTTSAAFAASSHNISGRSLTGLAVTQLMPTVAGWMTSKNFAAAAENVFNQSGWSSGDPLSVILASLTGTSTTFEMFDGNAVQAPILALFLGALPSRCNVVMGRKITGWTVKQF
jgi:hypothetical protein